MNNVRHHCLLLILLAVLAGCTPTKREHHLVTPVMTGTLRQYSCSAKVYLSDASKAYQLSGKVRGDTYDIQIGSTLEPRLDAMFWMNSEILTSGRPHTRINVGFGPGSYSRQAKNGALEVGVSLQFQIFHPTGQSYDGNVTGVAAMESVDESAGDALDQALMNLASELVSAGVCSPMQ